ncbi:MAG: YggS family pyridoxal phosphate enzyme, partial [Thermoleophilia bacterium]|nr:YggS family pyridoxal phosphate enzyme [Thermoleophilia bacterium]
DQGASRARAHARALVQVNIDADPTKDGLAPDAVAAFLEELPETIRVHGFMAMPAFAEDPEQS